MLPKRIPDLNLRRVQETENAKFSTEEAVFARKESWLLLFSNTLSPTISCRQTGVSPQALRKWINTDSSFGRAYNEIIDHMGDEIRTTILSKALGAAVLNEAGEIETDALGRIRYVGGSPQLLMYIADRLGLFGDAEVKPAVALELRVVPSPMRSGDVEKLSEDAAVDNG